VSIVLETFSIQKLKISLVSWILIGEWDAATATEPFGALEYNVARIFVHPQYTAANLRNNVAILRLANPVVLGQVCVPFPPLILPISISFSASNDNNRVSTKQFSHKHSLLGGWLGSQ
jgi:hypothetical protein